MKTNFPVVSALVGTLLFACGAARGEEPKLAVPSAEATKKPAGFGAVEFRGWHQGEPPVKLIRKDEGFCALTGVTGRFEGDGEQVRVYIGDDDYWYLGGQSAQKGVAATCVIVRYPETLKPAYVEPVKILAASYSFGSQYADVTARVRELLRSDDPFQANPLCLLVDPQPGWNKALVIFCQMHGKRAIFSVGEGENVSRSLIQEKARAVPEPGTSQNK